ncbi:hypothetical protein GBAR_LOCUS17123 [Geodia barretti]|uniref:Uncharacterized protein n=1 Tax=Geodia barretti TaxID=519541 RepID=A0AA35SJA3_GEOBA|nr:hypothetical protein GBAR_LOCUS17123 [Geodia barretti]
MSPGGKAAAVGVLMASFLLWLWLYDARETDEVAEWLEQRGLLHLRRHRPFKHLSSLEELVRVDLDSLPKPLQYSSSLPVLRQELQLLLELRLWLRERDMEDLLPQLLEAGHSSIHSLLALGPYDIKKLASQLSPAEQERFSARNLHVITISP